MLFQIFGGFFKKKSEIAWAISKNFKNFFFGLINFPDPPDHLPMLEASEIVVKVVQMVEIACMCYFKI